MFAPEKRSDCVERSSGRGHSRCTKRPRRDTAAAPAAVAAAVACGLEKIWDVFDFSDVCTFGTFLDRVRLFLKPREQTFLRANLEETLLISLAW